MANVIEMPKLSDTMEEGAIAAWSKKVGEFVEEGETICEIETDKATMDYQSPEEGVLVKIIVDAGTTCALNSPIAILAEKDEKFDEEALLAKYKGGGSEAPKEAEATPPAEVAPEPAQPAASNVVPLRQGSAEGGRVRASPLAKKIAKENGLDLGLISGSGPNGRVVQKDVETALKTGTGQLKPMPLPVAQLPMGQDVEIPLTMMRKTIAKRLLAGKNDAPHFYLNRSCDMTNLMAWRKKLNDSRDYKVSVNDLLILATAKALKKHPEVNSSWAGDKIIRYGSVHDAFVCKI